MNSTTLWLIVAGYLAIFFIVGGFLNEVFDDGSDHVLAAFFWPVTLAFGILCGIVWCLMKIGELLGRLFK